MPDKSKSILAHLALAQQVALKNCKCGGSGQVEPKNIGLVPWDITWQEPIPCPTCAPVRALDAEFKLWAEILTWPCNTKSLTTEPCKIDGKPQGKLLIVHIMEVLGLWEGFLMWNWIHNNQELNGIQYVNSVDRIPRMADILTNGPLLVDAINSYLEGRE